MRFASIGGQSNYAQAGKAVARDAEKALDVTRKNSVDFGGLAQAGMEVRSKEKIAATNAGAYVKKAEIAADKTEKLHAAKMKGAKAGVMRKAGGLIALGMDGFRKEEKTDYSSIRARIDRDRTKATELREQSEAIDISPKLTDAPTNTGGTGASGASTTSSSGKVSSDISAQHSAGGGALSKTQIKSYAEQAGFSPENAATVVGIAGGESGYDPTNSTVRSGLHAKTGEDSVGLMQINWGYHKDSGWLQGLGIHKREDLFDPANNMKAAKYLYDGRGNFGDWTVHNKGIYKDYLKLNSKRSTQ